MSSDLNLCQRMMHIYVRSALLPHFKMILRSEMVRGPFRGLCCTTALYIFELNKGVIHRDLIESKILTLL